jgi:hypothetical protein
LQVVARRWQLVAASGGCLLWPSRLSLMQQISPLNSIEGCHVKHEFQSSKYFSLQWLCKDICNLIICISGYQFNFFVLHMFSDEVMTCINVYHCKTSSMYKIWDSPVPILERMQKKCNEEKRKIKCERIWISSHYSCE